MNTLHRQRGANTVEFAITAGIFFVMLLAVIEFGRLIYTWQTLDEVSRRAARMAVVCPINFQSVKQIAVFNNPGTSGESAVLPRLTDEHVVLEYLDQSGNALANPVGAYDAIRFVRAHVRGYDHTLLIPGLPPSLGRFTFPDITTVLPRESLGVWPEGTGCLGTYM